MYRSQKMPRTYRHRPYDLRKRVLLNNFLRNQTIALTNGTVHAHNDNLIGKQSSAERNLEHSKKIGSEFDRTARSDTDNFSESVVLQNDENLDSSRNENGVAGPLSLKGAKCETEIVLGERDEVSVSTEKHSEYVCETGISLNPRPWQKINGVCEQFDSENEQNCLQIKSPSEVNGTLCDEKQYSSTDPKNSKIFVKNHFSFCKKNRDFQDAPKLLQDSKKMLKAGSKRHTVKRQSSIKRAMNNFLSVLSRTKETPLMVDSLLKKNKEFKDKTLISKIFKTKENKSMADERNAPVVENETGSQKHCQSGVNNFTDVNSNLKRSVSVQTDPVWTWSREDLNNIKMSVDVLLTAQNDFRNAANLPFSPSETAYWLRSKSPKQPQSSKTSLQFCSDTNKKPKLEQCLGEKKHLLKSNNHPAHGNKLTDFKEYSNTSSVSRSKSVQERSVTVIDRSSRCRRASSVRLPTLERKTSNQCAMISTRFQRINVPLPMQCSGLKEYTEFQEHLRPLLKTRTPIKHKPIETSRHATNKNWSPTVLRSWSVRGNSNGVEKYRTCRRTRSVHVPGTCRRLSFAYKD